MDKIYAVVEEIEQRFSNVLGWEDGYYDDYYDTVVNYLKYIAFYSNKEEAVKCSRYFNENQYRETRIVELTVNKTFNKKILAKL